jgi:hypothetical protein
MYATHYVVMWLAVCVHTLGKREFISLSRTVSMQLASKSCEENIIIIATELSTLQSCC